VSDVEICIALTLNDNGLNLNKTCFVCLSGLHVVNDFSHTCNFYLLSAFGLSPGGSGYFTC